LGRRVNPRRSASSTTKRRGWWTTRKSTGRRLGPKAYTEANQHCSGATTSLPSLQRPDHPALAAGTRSPEAAANFQCRKPCRLLLRKPRKRRRGTIVVGWRLSSSLAAAGKSSQHIRGTLKLPRNTTATQALKAANYCFEIIGGDGGRSVHQKPCRLMLRDPRKLPPTLQCCKPCRLRLRAKVAAQQQCPRLAFSPSVSYSEAAAQHHCRKLCRRQIPASKSSEAAVALQHVARLAA